MYSTVQYLQVYNPHYFTWRYSTAQYLQLPHISIPEGTLPYNTSSASRQARKPVNKPVNKSLSHSARKNTIFDLCTLTTTMDKTKHCYRPPKIIARSQKPAPSTFHRLSRCQVVLTKILFVKNIFFIKKICFATIWLVEFCKILNWVLSQFEFLNFVIISLFEFAIIFFLVLS